ncbi:alpha/beta fold hydrolase [Nocardioides psychrotolerans]|uniref:alpha/beta hydrolase n=1 Tax=Nocardioides psychrotolerans TaxID=1005945 RepID=UPI003137ED49
MAAPETTREQTAPGPSVTRLDVASEPRGVVLMLHGGKQASMQSVDHRSASWRRFAAMQRSITPRAHAAGVSTWLLRYTVRGWNHGAPVDDARWAIEEVRRELGDVPVVLLGHSMGGRTAVHVADAPSVVGVVAVAPWWSPEDPVHTLSGRQVHAAHGRTDKITSARMTRAYLERATPIASSASFTDMGRVGHYMFRRVDAWNTFAIDTSLDLLG